MDTVRFADMTDEDIAAEAQGGDMAAAERLMDKYKYLVRSEAHGYFLMGADHEDLVQEGMIGLFKAVRDYRSGLHFSFRAFAEMCVRRQLLTAISAANRQKDIPMNTYISLSAPMHEDAAGERGDYLCVDSGRYDPERCLIASEEKRVLKEKLVALLTPLEKRVLDMYVDGESYQQISSSIGRSEKCIDNAIQRIRKKAAKCIAEND